VQLCTIKSTKLEFAHINTESLFHLYSFSAPLKIMTFLLVCKAYGVVIILEYIVYIVNNTNIIIIKTKLLTHALVHNTKKVYQPVLRETRTKR